MTTIGGFVQPGQKVMEVVPLGDKLLVETRVKPSDIAFIKVGDRALVKVTAYDFSTYGGLDGRVVQVSGGLDLRRSRKRGVFHGHRRDRQGLSDGVRQAASDHARNDDRHPDHHRTQERAQLFVEAGDEGAQRGAQRALISARREGASGRISAEAMFTGERLRR